MISILLKDVKPFDAYNVFKANPSSHGFAKYMLDEGSDHISESENDFTFLRKGYLRRYFEAVPLKRFQSNDTPPIFCSDS